MFVKIEPTGCCERKGMVQVRFCMYLEPSDYGYDKHHIQVPVIPESGYPGELNDMGVPLDIGDYDSWLASLPKVWQDNPFHNHFVYVEPDTTDKEIMDIGGAFLKEAYTKWGCEEKLELRNPPVGFYPSVGSARARAVQDKVQHLKKVPLERRV